MSLSTDDLQGLTEDLQGEVDRLRAVVLAQDARWVRLAELLGQDKTLAQIGRELEDRRWSEDTPDLSDDVPMEAS